MREHRGTIFLEKCEIVFHQAYAGDQQIMGLRAPKCAATARPGQFVHLQTDRDIPLRRPISIMRTDPNAGTIELLYKVIGTGTRRLANRQVGERISCLGPIGTGFTFDAPDIRPLLIGGGVGMPPMFFLAKAMREAGNLEPLVLLGSEVPFPFQSTPSQFLIEGLDPGVIAAAPLLEDWGVPSRLASLAGFPGCHEGYVTELAAQWLSSLDEATRKRVAIYACGPHAMLQAVADLAHRHALPCQLSLEEFMACGVGGCAGCTVKVETPDGSAMKRVCVDGPVFEASAVYPAA